MIAAKERPRQVPRAKQGDPRVECPPALGKERIDGGTWPAQGQSWKKPKSSAFLDAPHALRSRTLSATRVSRTPCGGPSSGALCLAPNPEIRAILEELRGFAGGRSDIQR